MTLTIQERAVRCQQVINAYSDDDTYTNLIDFLTDAMHWCRVNGHDFVDALEIAVIHLDAEMIDNNKHQSSNKRKRPKTKSKPDPREAQRPLLRSLTDEAQEAFWQVIVQRYPQAETGDLSPWVTITLQTAAENAIAEWVNNNVPATTSKGD